MKRKVSPVPTLEARGKGMAAPTKSGYQPPYISKQGTKPKYQVGGCDALCCQIIGLTGKLSKKIISGFIFMIKFARDACEQEPGSEAMPWLLMRFQVCKGKLFNQQDHFSNEMTT